VSSYNLSLGKWREKKELRNDAEIEFESSLNTNTGSEIDIATCFLIATICGIYFWL
jgi:hypothetical protein